MTCNCKGSKNKSWVQAVKTVAIPMLGRTKSEEAVKHERRQAKRTRCKEAKKTNQESKQEDEGAK